MGTKSLEEKDIGKHVVNTDGARVGLIVSVKDGVAHVDANPNTKDKIKAKLGLNSVSEFTFPLDLGEVSTNNRDESCISRKPFRAAR